MNVRFAVVSDLHIALPETILNHAHRFHLVEVSIPAFEVVLKHLETLDLDFLLLPGDLTQDGEPENHLWLQQRLASLPFPAYVIPGNHDVPSLTATDRVIAFEDFPAYYRPFGYAQALQMYYTCEVYPGVQLIALNSNQFDGRGKQLGCLDEEQIIWLEKILPQLEDKLVLVMVHHNVIEHLPGQAQHSLGKRYMLDNAPLLFDILRQFGVKLIFTGHLHIQDITQQQGIYEITTGSLVSYPHPYRLLELTTNAHGETELKIESHRVNKLYGWENLPQQSKKWLGDRSFPFMMKLLTEPPLNLDISEAEKFAPYLRDFWANIAAGDALLDFPHFPLELNRHFQQFGAINTDGTPNLIDNHTTIDLL
jgi:3',5'-cyclic AMP phosphodiesterase CpdA